MYLTRWKMRCKKPHNLSNIRKYNKSNYVVNVLFATTNKGQQRFASFVADIDAMRLSDFMGKLVNEAESKIILILAYCLSKELNRSIRRWLDEHKNEIEVIVCR